MNSRASVLACLLLGIVAVSEARVLLADIGLKLSSDEATALRLEKRRTGQHNPSAIDHDKWEHTDSDHPNGIKPSASGRCPYGYHIMGEDSESSTPRITDRDRYWCKRTDKIHTIPEGYQNQDSMDPEGTQVAKEVTGVTLKNGEKDTNFMSVNAKDLAEADDNNARDEADDVAALAAAKTKEVLDEANTEFELAKNEDPHHSTLKK